MEDKLKLLKQGLGDFRIKTDEPLTYHTIIHLNSTARFFYIATNQNELIEVLNCAYQLQIPYLLLGAGTKFDHQGQELNALVIKNRTGNIKISGIKGKVGKAGVGVDEALVEVDSGVSLGKLNEFLKIQGLQLLNIQSSLQSTLGGSIRFDRVLQEMIQKIKVWQDEEVYEMEVEDLKSHQNIILSAVLRIKAP